MQIEYTLTEREIQFLHALADKAGAAYSWGGNPVDSEFKRIWKEEIQTFVDANLAELKRPDKDDYTCYGLTPAGMELYKKYSLPAGIIKVVVNPMVEEDYWYRSLAGHTFDVKHSNWDDLRQVTGFHNAEPKDCYTVIGCDYDKCVVLRKHVNTVV